MIRIEEFWLEPAIKRAAAKGGRMLDIGANRGEWTRLMAPHFDEIDAYEPDPRCLEVLEFEAQRACDDTPCSIFIHQAAVGAFEASATLFLREGSAQSSLSKKHPFGHGRVVSQLVVPQISLIQAVGDEGADFVKIDIEGAERDLVYPTNVRSYLIECHGTYDEVMPKIPECYAIWKFSHVHPAADPGHCWIFCDREVSV